MPRAEGSRLSGKRIALFSVTASVLVFIFVQSMLPQSVSANESNWLTEKILNPFLRLFGLGPLTDHTVRKIAHMTEFAVLSALLLQCFRGRFLKSFCSGFAAAFLDESIQLLSGRGASIADVWIDLLGVAIGVLLGILLCKAKRRRYGNGSL